MSSDSYEITIEDAQDIAQWVSTNNGQDTPLVGLEEKLLALLLHAQHIHDQAIENDAFRQVGKRPLMRLRNTLQKTLDALDNTPVNLEFIDPVLDERSVDPSSQSDLRGMLRRAIKVINQNSELMLDRHDPDGKLPRKMRSHPKGISSVGLREMVELLRGFWEHEIEYSFTADFDNELNECGNHGELVPKSLAAKFICYSAKLIDPNYNAEACSNAMRPR